MEPVDPVWTGKNFDIFWSSQIYWQKLHCRSINKQHEKPAELSFKTKLWKLNLCCITLCYLCVIMSHLLCKIYSGYLYIAAFNTSSARWCMQSTMDSQQRISASWSAQSPHNHYALDYAPPAPQTMPCRDYSQSSVNDLTHTLDRQRGTLFRTNWLRAVETLNSFEHQLKTWHSKHLF